MTRRLLLALLLVAATATHAQKKLTKNKAAIAESVENHKSDLIKISDDIWANAEIAFEEYESSKSLADYAEANGFTVERGVADMETAFVATYGSGKPVIGILAEYDALPGMSQQVAPQRSPVKDGEAGHACWHSGLGTGALGAA